MDSVKGKPYDTPALHESCVLGTAVDCISFDNKYAHIFQYLGRTLVVSSMDDAIDYRKIQSAIAHRNSYRGINFNLVVL